MYTCLCMYKSSRIDLIKTFQTVRSISPVLFGTQLGDVCWLNLNLFFNKWTEEMYIRMCVGLLVCCLFTWQSEGIPQREYFLVQAPYSQTRDYFQDKQNPQRYFLRIDAPSPQFRKQIQGQGIPQGRVFGIQAPYPLVRDERKNLEDNIAPRSNILISPRICRENFKEQLNECRQIA